MKFNVSSKILYNYASAVNKVINTKNALSILNNFLMTLDGETLTITGSDIENSLTATVAVTEPSGSGSFCVEAKRFVDLLKEIPEQGITVEVDSHVNVHVTYASGRYDFVALDGSEYPAYKKDEDDGEPQTFSCPASVISRGIENTIFAASTDDYRPQMMGVFFDIKTDQIIFVATDTRKLVKFADRSVNPGISASCIIPAKPATILRTVFNSEDDLQISLSRKSATISSPTFCFNCRFIQGNFPDYNRVIPRNNTLTLTADRVSLLNAVRRVGLFVDPGYGLEKFKITPDNIEMKSEDNNLQMSARENVPCSFTGESLIIGFSAPFLYEILNTISTTVVVVDLSDPGRPGIFRPSENEENTEMLMLLMPMTVGDF